MDTIVRENEILIGDQYSQSLVGHIGRAVDNIKILMFDWRWYVNDITAHQQLINHALVKAVRRGVKVKAITNYENIVDTLTGVGVEAKKWQSKKIMHSKLVLIDNKLTLIGSHNFTQRAMTSNHEISVLLDDPDLTSSMAVYFDDLWLL